MVVSGAADNTCNGGTERYMELVWCVGSGSWQKPWGAKCGIYIYDYNSKEFRVTELMCTGNVGPLKYSWGPLAHLTMSMHKVGRCSSWECPQCGIYL